MARMRVAIKGGRESGMTIGVLLASRRKRLISTVVGVVLVCLIAAAPAAAEPTPPSVPDPGARPPAAGGSVQAAAGVPSVLGPLAQQIRTETLAVQALEQQFTQLDASVTALTQDAAARRQAWQDAVDELEQAESRADGNAAAAYKAARSLGPLGEHADELRQFGMVVPSFGQIPGTGAYGRELAQAQATAAARRSALASAEETLRSATARRDQVKAAYDVKKTALADLMARNSSQLAAVEAQQDAYEGAAGAQLGVGEQVAGMVADPRALAAVQHALRQLGKPYEWGAEGPNTYDCSGLTWDAYRTVGVKLPRVAADQYNATTKISEKGLLPGDLLFFGPPGPWAGISHMGMYIGNGKMVQAPSTGDVVKISTPWWSNFYGATRVLPAVPAPVPGTQPPSTAPSTPVSPPPSTPSTSPAPSVSSSSPSSSPSPSRSSSSTGSAVPSSTGSPGTGSSSSGSSSPPG